MYFRQTGPHLLLSLTRADWYFRLKAVQRLSLSLYITVHVTINTKKSPTTCPLYRITILHPQNISFARISGLATKTLSVRNKTGLSPLYRALFEHTSIAYTEQGENHGTMIVDGVCYFAIHFGRVILYEWRSPLIVKSFLASTLLLKYFRLRASTDACASPLITTLSTISSSNHIFETLSPFLWRG